MIEMEFCPIFIGRISLDYAFNGFNFGFFERPHLYNRAKGAERKFFFVDKTKQIQSKTLLPAVVSFIVIGLKYQNTLWQNLKFVCGVQQFLFLSIAFFP
jgi:hypothetical protein